jgi:hypothetical protein
MFWCSWSTFQHPHTREANGMVRRRVIARVISLSICPLLSRICMPPRGVSPGANEPRHQDDTRVVAMQHQEIRRWSYRYRYLGWSPDRINENLASELERLRFDPSNDNRKLENLFSCFQTTETLFSQSAPPGIQIHHVQPPTPSPPVTSSMPFATTLVVLVASRGFLSVNILVPTPKSSALATQKR